MTLVEIFADGSCRNSRGTGGGGGPGGWGTVLRYGKHEREMSGFDSNTTNNRMEMMAAIAGLEALTRPCQVRVTSDSQYLVKGMTHWIGNWQRRNWNGVANPDLWQRMLAAANPHKIEWCWVRGHNGHLENERCDELAGVAMRLQKGSDRRLALST